MDLQFTIDHDLCTQCNACADDCPSRIINLNSGFPEITPERVQYCLQCQHCFAICPTGALSIFGLDPKRSLAIPESLPNPTQLEAMLRARRAIRSYHPEALEPQLIDELIKIAANAPTGKNKCQCLFTVIDQPKSMNILRQETIAGLRRAFDNNQVPKHLSYFRGIVSAWDKGQDIIFRNAPHLLIISVPPDVTTPDADAVIAMSYFELAAASRGVGALWNAMVRWAFSIIEGDMYLRLGIPEDHVKGYAMIFGRPAVQYHRTVQRDHALINRVRL